MNKKIIICTGGTGGHVIPAINFGNFLIKNGFDCKLIIDKRGSRYTSKFKGKIHVVNASHLSGNIYFKFKSLLNLFIGFIKSFYVIIKNKPTHFISFGGYATFMPLLVVVILKFILKTKLYIHEQNTIIGKVNLFFLPYIKNIFTNFENIKNLDTIYLKKKIYVGLPNDIFFDIKGIDNNRREDKTIFVYGGSQGSSQLIDNLLSILENIDLKNFNNIKFIIQAPIMKHNELKNFFKENSIKNQIKDFFINIDEILSMTDIAFTRAGAGTINDLIKYQIPSIIFPLPQSIYNHQFSNAKYLSERGAAILMNEKNFNKKQDSSIFYKFIADTHRQQEMKNILKKIILPNANQTMLNNIKI